MLLEEGVIQRNQQHVGAGAEETWANCCSGGEELTKLHERQVIQVGEAWEERYGVGVTGMSVNASAHTMKLPHTPKVSHRNQV